VAIAAAPSVTVAFTALTDLEAFARAKRIRLIIISGNTAESPSVVVGSLWQNYFLH